MKPKSSEGKKLPTQKAIRDNLNDLVIWVNKCSMDNQGGLDKWQQERLKEMIKNNFIKPFIDITSLTKF